MMPNANQAVRFIGCNFSSYEALGTYNPNTIYFCTDTQQIFLGDREYTKSVRVLTVQPTASTVGENGRLYAYNGNLYMCQTQGYTYVWTRVANVNDTLGTVTNVIAGDGLNGGTITESGTISHAVPTGTVATADTLTDVNPAFGDTFQIAGVQTDKFGHVTSVTLHQVTLPAESEVAVSVETQTAETLVLEGEFDVVTEVTRGTGTHDLSFKKKKFKLPKAIDNITYSMEVGDTSGSLKLVGSDGSVAEGVVKDWEKLAKVTDITSIFHYKGKKEKKTQLPIVGAVGDVYYVVEDSTEYIFLGPDEGWEEFGPAIDLTPYAKSADVIQRLTGKTGEVPKFASDGTVVSTGFMLEKSVPANAVFTDTVYTHPDHTPHGAGLYRIQVDAQGHVTSAALVQKSDITGLGIPSENTDCEVTTNPMTAAKVYLTGTDSSSLVTGELQINTDAYLSSDGSITAAGFHGKADTAGAADTAAQATKALQDGEGNVIKDHYATKEDVQNATSVWEII